MTTRNEKTTTKSFKNVAFLVLSCDKYSDLWPIFFESMSRYLPNIDIPVYLGSNTLKYNGVQTILSGEDRDWSTSLLSILSQLKETTVIVWLEDLLFVENANTNMLYQSLDYFINNNMLHMHMQPTPAPDRMDGANFGIYDAGCPYRVNVAGFWDKEYLMKLLIPGESPWNFEIMGSYRSSYSEGFGCIFDTGLKWINSVEKGQWLPKSVKQLLFLGLKPDLARRGLLRNSRLWKSHLQEFVFNAILRIPWRKRIAWMNRLRRLLISY